MDTLRLPHILTIPIIVFSMFLPTARASAPDANIMSWTYPNDIHAMTAVGDTLWCATGGGIVAFDMITGEYTVYTTLDGLPANQFSTIDRNSKGDLLFLTDKTAIYYSDGTWTSQKIQFDFENTFLYDFACGENLEFWGITSNNTLLTNAGGTWHEISFPPPFEGKKHDFEEVEVDTHGDVWISTQLGLVHYSNGKSKLITKFQDLEVERITKLTVIDGEVAICYNGACIIRNGDSWDVIYPGMDISMAVIDADDTLWMASGSGLYSYDGDTTTQYVEDLMIRHIACDSLGRIWYAPYYVFENGLRCYDGETFRTVKFDSILEHSAISDIAVDDRDNLWISYAYPHYLGIPPVRGGISYFDGHESTHYTIDNSGLLSNRVVTIALDNDSTPWIGFFYHGVSHLENDLWQPYIKPEGIEVKDMFHAKEIIFENDNTGWFCFEKKGLARYCNGETNFFNTDNGVPMKRIHTCALDNSNNLWFANNDSLAFFDGTNFELYEIDSTIEYAYYPKMAIDNENAVWISFAGEYHPWDMHNKPGGLVRFKNGVWTTYTTANGLPSDAITTVNVDTFGTLWIGTEEKGVARLVNGEWECWSTKDGLADDEVLCIDFDNAGNTWVGTQQGLSRMTVPEPPVTVESEPVPKATLITALSPNPFNMMLTITLALPKPGHTRINVYNMLGQNIRTLASSHMPAGSHTLKWNGLNDHGEEASNGAYVIHVDAGGVTDSRKVMLIK